MNEEIRSEEIKTFGDAVALVDIEELAAEKAVNIIYNLGHDEAAKYEKSQLDKAYLTGGIIGGGCAIIGALLIYKYNRDKKRRAEYNKAKEETKTTTE